MNGSRNSSTEVRDKRHQPWFWVDNAIIYQYAAQMKPMALACYVYLCCRANENDQQCWPSQRTIAEELGVDRGTVRSAVKQLKNMGLISLEVRRNEDGSHKSTIYTLLNVPKKEQGGGSIAQGGSLTQGGLNSPEQDSLEEDSLNNSPEGASAAPDATTADIFVSFLAEELDAADVPYTKGWRGRHGQQFAEHIKKGVPDSTLYKACDRITERWTGEQHYKLTVEQAVGDVVNGPVAKTNGQLNTNGASDSVSPAAAIEAIRNHDYLKRYAPLLKQFDFSQLEEYEQPPYKIYVNLGGDDTERVNNLVRIHSVVRRALRD